MNNNLAIKINIKDVNELKTYTIIIGYWKENNSLKNNMLAQGIMMNKTLILQQFNNIFKTGILFSKS